MTNREIFIETVERLFETAEGGIVPLEAYAYLETLREVKEAASFTEKGYPIFEWMRNNVDAYNNAFTAKVIAEGLDSSSRTVSGSLRKICEDGWVIKTSSNPSVYSLSEAGLAYELVVANA